MRWNATLGKKPEDIQALKLSNLKGLVKSQLQTKMKDTTAMKPTNFVAVLGHQYPDGNIASLLLLGLWKGKIKNWATRVVAKQKGAIVGEAYYNGKTETGKQIIVFNILKGRGKSEVDRIKKKLYPFIPKTKYEIQFLDNNPIEKDKKVSPPKKMLDQTQALQELLRQYKRESKEGNTPDNAPIKKAIRQWLVDHNELEEKHQELLKNWFLFFKKQWGHFQVKK
jgi:hypothetical protein